MDTFGVGHTHDIQISKGCRSSMDHEEIEVVRRFTDVLLYEEVNLLSATKYLYEQELITRNQFDELCFCFNENPYLKFVEQFIKLVTGNIRLEELIQSLFHSGNESAAQKLFRVSLSTHNRESDLLIVQRINARNKRSIESYFRSLKRVVHNGKLEEPLKWLRKVANVIKIRMDKEQNPMKKQFYADKFVAHLGAEIDAMAITFDRTLPDSEIFDDLKSLSETSSQPLISDIVYFGRRANALAIAGRFEEGENMVVGAHCCATFAGPCLEIANMIYIDVYFKLWQFEQIPSLQLQRELIFAGNKGLWALSEEDEDTRNLWTRMFLLRMIFCLLGIGNKANIIENYEVPNQNIPEADKLIHAIQLEGIETRRAMFYWVAKARYYELLNDESLSIQSIKKAEQLAKKGHFKEIVNIEKYALALRHRFPAQNSDSVEQQVTLPSAPHLSGTSASRQQTSCEETDIKCVCTTESDRILEKENGEQQSRIDVTNLFSGRRDDENLSQTQESMPGKNDCDTADDRVLHQDETEVKELDVSDGEATNVKEIITHMTEHNDFTDDFSQSLTYSVVVEDFESKGSFPECNKNEVKVEVEKSNEENRDELNLGEFETLDVNSLLNDI